MNQDGEIAASVKGHKEDRISVLPRELIDSILERLPIKDAAITSILSKNWRYIWPTLPNLVLDRFFFSDLAERSQSFKKAVDAILLVHRGDIWKFVLHVPSDLLSSYEDIDRWMLCVTRNGVEELQLNMPDLSSYKLPSSVFNCPTLTSLELVNCVFKPTKSLLTFQNLYSLYLDGVTIVPTTKHRVIKAPHLVYFDMRYCNGTQYLNIVSPQLESLCIFAIDHYLVLNCFMSCKKLRELHFRGYKAAKNLKHDERSTLEKLFLSLAPTVKILELDSYYLQLLRAHTVPTGSPFPLNCLRSLMLSLDFGKLGPTSGTLRLLRSVPNLAELDIWVHDACDNAEAVLKYLNPSAYLDRPLNQLKHVSLGWFNGSKTELLFIKLLLARAPSLESMTIWQLDAFDSVRQGNITKELRSFPRASPNAELVCSIHHKSKAT